MSAPSGITPPSALHSGLQALRDNLEAFTIALVMALLIKHFCVEAFKIPTSSMEPTLHGDDGDGDRILVDKWAYLFHGPERGDVVVFHYPLNLGKHFIKRVGGVGPEWLNIVEGDIWTRANTQDPWRIARKRPRVRDGLYVAVYPPDAEPSAGSIAKTWNAEEGWEIPSFTQMRFRGGGERSVTYGRQIRSRSAIDSLSYAGDGRAVEDVRVRFRATLEANTVLTVLWRTESGRTAQLKLATQDLVEGSEIRARREGFDRTASVGQAIQPGVPVDVTFECVDGEVIARVGEGDEVHLDEERLMADAAIFSGSEQSLRITARGGAVTLDGVGIDRDIWYTTDGIATLGADGEGVWVPADHYFMLGDNSPHSSDSRKWTRRAIDLRDGTRFYYDSTQTTRPRIGEDGRYHVEDVEGIERSWLPSEEDTSRHEPQEEAPFVSRDLVVGRAFFVFWPVLPKFPGRLKFIH